MYLDTKLTGEQLIEARQNLQRFNNPGTKQQLRNSVHEIFLYYSRIRDGGEVITMPSGQKTDIGTATDKYIINLYFLFKENSFESIRALHARVLLCHEVLPRSPTLDQRLVKLVQIANSVRNFL